MNPTTLRRAAATVVSVALSVAIARAVVTYGRENTAAFTLGLSVGLGIGALFALLLATLARWENQ